MCAHVDTLGAMVRSVTADGQLKIMPVGGYMMQTIEGEYCTIHARRIRQNIYGNCADDRAFGACVRRCPHSGTQSRQYGRAH